MTFKLTIGSLALLMMFVFTACGGATPDADGMDAVATDANEMPAKPDVPESAPATKADEFLANDGTRKVGDITKCLVSGDVFTVEADSPKAEHDGGTYYMCCEGCVDKFTADPAKFISGQAEKATAPAGETMPNDGSRKVGDTTLCPVSGKTFTIAADSPTAEHDGKTYFMCCGGCVKKFKADPAKFIKAS